MRTTKSARMTSLALLLLCLPVAGLAGPVRPGGAPERSIHPPSRMDASAGHRPPASRTSGHPGGRGHRRLAGDASAPVNINTADAAALEALTGVGEKKARAIVAFRKVHGPFSTLDDFEAVPGIGPAMIEANRERIRFR